MTNKQFMELYNTTLVNHNKLHNMSLTGVKIDFVDGSGKRVEADIANCLDFGDITAKGSVLITHEHGTYLKVDEQYWTLVTKCSKSWMHDLDVVHILVIESENRVSAAILIDPGE